MGAFLRRLAALAALTTLCELLLPEGGLRRAVRLTVGVMTASLLLSGLLSAGQALLGGGTVSVESAMQAALEESAAQAEQEGAEAALRAYANQARSLCVRMAEQAGYRCKAAVYLTREGACDHVEWRLTAERPVIDEMELTQRVADTFGLSVEQIRTMEAMPP